MHTVSCLRVLADTQRSGYAQLAYTVTCSHLSCIRQIARKLLSLDSQLASQTYMYFIIEREHKLGYIHVSMQLCYVLWMKNCKSCKAAGAPPQTPMGELTALPQLGERGLRPLLLPPPLLITSTLLLSRTPPSPDQPTGLYGFFSEPSCNRRCLGNCECSQDRRCRRHGCPPGKSVPPDIHA